jgi:outer membrane protein assembly factor BamE (lipoprotein component of BamABCDE complex)
MSKGSMTRVLAVGILIFGTAGCAERGERQIADPGRISQIQKGVSTKASIKALFGEPEGMYFSEDGDEVWAYTYTAPVIGKTALMLGIKAFRQLSVTFDKNGILKAYGTYGS